MELGDQMPEVVPLQGPGVPIPHDMEEGGGLPDDLTIIARLIDANCRAYSELYGWHLDSRCLSHYNEGIVRLSQAGVTELIPPVNPDGSPKEGEPFEEVTDSPAQAVRVRATYVPFEKMVDRPTSDPMWKLQSEEMARLRHELTQLRAGHVDASMQPSGPRTAPIIPPGEMPGPEWMMTMPNAPVPDPRGMPRVGGKLGPMPPGPTTIDPENIAPVGDTD
jgi:hypothetical protein